MHTALPITAIGLLLSLALYWVFAEGSAQAPRSDQDQRPGGTASETASIALAQDRRELESTEQASEVANEPETAPADASLEVTVLEDRSGDPLPDVKLTALEFEAITNAQGPAQLQLPSGSYRLRAEPPDETLQDGVIFFEDFLSPPGVADETRIIIPPGSWLVRILVGSEESFRQEIVVRAGEEVRVCPG